MQTQHDVEAWLSGAVENVPALLHPVAHALLQEKKEVTTLLLNFNESKLWEKPAGVASVGFHLQHLAGVLDRLFTYARAESLTEKQLHYLSEEGKPKNNITIKTLIENFNNQVDISIDALCQTNAATLTRYRSVGRKQLPSTVIGLLFHSAEHTMRHVGQLMVTVKILSALT